MELPSKDELIAKRCVPCEGGVSPFTLESAQGQVSKLEGWRLTHGGKKIRRQWEVRDFVAGMSFLNRVAELAEAEGHHPDVHLEGYRNVSIDLWTHSIGGLSENDFIVAAKINVLPIETGGS